MKKIKIFFTVAVIAANFVIFAQNTSAGTAASAPTKGKKGTIGGVDTCHCPDDSGECYCNGSITPANPVVSDN